MPPWTGNESVAWNEPSTAGLDRTHFVFILLATGWRCQQETAESHCNWNALFGIRNIIEFRVNKQFLKLEKCEICLIFIQLSCSSRSETLRLLKDIWNLGFQCFMLFSMPSLRPLPWIVWGKLLSDSGVWSQMFPYDDIRHFQTRPPLQGDYIWLSPCCRFCIDDCTVCCYVTDSDFCFVGFKILLFLFQMFNWAPAQFIRWGHFVDDCQLGHSSLNGVTSRAGNTYLVTLSTGLCMLVSSSLGDSFSGWRLQEDIKRLRAYVLKVTP